MLVKMSGFRFIVKGLPHIGNVLDFLLVNKFKINVIGQFGKGFHYYLSCPGKVLGAPFGWTYSSSEYSSLEAISVKQI